MSSENKEPQSEEHLETLSEKELAILHRNWKLLHNSLYYDTLRRVSKFFGAALAICTVAGIFSLTALKDNIITTTSSRIANDAELRQEIIDNVTEQVANLERLQQKMKQELSDFVDAKDLAIYTFKDDLSQIRQMLDDIRARLRQELNDD